MPTTGITLGELPRATDVATGNLQRAAGVRPARASASMRRPLAALLVAGACVATVATGGSLDWGDLVATALGLPHPPPVTYERVANADAEQIDTGWARAAREDRVPPVRDVRPEALPPDVAAVPATTIPPVPSEPAVPAIQPVPESVPFVPVMPSITESRVPAASPETATAPVQQAAPAPSRRNASIQEEAAPAPRRRSRRIVRRSRKPEVRQAIRREPVPPVTTVAKVFDLPAALRPTAAATPGP